MTTSVPSIQRGSGSRRSTGETPQHDGVVWWRTKSAMASPSGWPEGGQLDKGERSKCVHKRELPPLHI